MLLEDLLPELLFELLEGLLGLDLTEDLLFFTLGLFFGLLEDARLVFFIFGAEAPPTVCLGFRGEDARLVTPVLVPRRLAVEDARFLLLRVFILCL